MPYCTKQDVLDILGIAGISDVTSDDIPDSFLIAADAEIDARTNTAWTEVAASEVILNGTGYDWVVVPKVPIVAITGLFIRDVENENEQEITVDGSEDEVQIMHDPETGYIYLKPDVDFGFTIFSRLMDDDTNYDGATFPKGVQNVTVQGTFGRTDPLVERIASWIIVRDMGKINAKKYGFGKISERLGKYDYSLGNSSRIMSTDDLIDYLFNLLPKDNTYGFEAI